MAKIDMHKLALAVGFEVVCVDDDYTNYEYMIRLRDIESMSYVVKIKNKIEFSDVDEILQSLVIVLPKDLRRKIKKLMRKKDEENIDNLIDLLCFTVEQYNNDTRYAKLKEYGELVGINIEDFGYYFTYKLPKKKYLMIMSLIESKLDFEDSVVVGKIKKIDYKMGYLKQNKKMEAEI